MSEETGFDGAKLALFIGPLLVVIERDDVPWIPWPGHLDFPGGGREGDESPLACALRETQEELGLEVPPERVVWSRRYPQTDGARWLFVARLPAGAEASIVFGNEGAGWQLMSPQDYAAHPKRIPQFADRLGEWTGVRG